MFHSSVNRYIFTVLVFVVLSNVHCVFKITKLKYESPNETIFVVHKCRLQPKDRHITLLYLNGTFKQSIRNIMVYSRVGKRANGYKPFLINITTDFCVFLKRRNSPVFKIIYNLFKDFSNINHTCPYEGAVIIDGFYPTLKHLNNLPLPTGEYVLYLSWFEGNFNFFNIDVYFEFKND